MDQNEKDRMTRAFQFMEETGVLPQAADRDEDGLWWTIDWRFSTGVIHRKLDEYDQRSPEYFKSALLALEKAIEITGWGLADSSGIRSLASSV